MVDAKVTFQISNVDLGDLLPSFVEKRCNACSAIVVVLALAQNAALIPSSG